MGFVKTAGKVALRKAAARLADGGDGAIVSTDRPSGRVSCRFCGCRVRSNLGNVCSHPACQRLAAE